MRDYFDTEHLGKRAFELARDLSVDTKRLGIRVRTTHGETIETTGYEAQDDWLEVATSDETIRVLPWTSVVEVEIYVANEDVKPRVGFSAPGDR